MSDITNCPNCNTSLKGGLIGAVKLISDRETRIINEYNQKKAPGYCNKCGNDLYAEYSTMYAKELGSLESKIQSLINCLPIITIQSPLNWDYEVAGTVTAQSVCGTGFFTEFSSSFNDLFGEQSNSLTKKLKQGENFCSAQLRKLALDMGANAIVGVDIDYSEIGHGKGMIMVCMAGTAIELRNLEILREKRRDNLDELQKANKRHQHLSQVTTKPRSN